MARTKKPLPWIGDTATGEIHRRASLKPQCNEGKIKPDHRVEGETFSGLKKQDRRLKDACAHCRRKFKSRDNK